MSAAAAYLRALPTMLRVGFAEMVAYRAEVAVWILTATLPLVMLALWSAAAGDGALEGYGQDEFARYFTVTLVVRQLTSTWVVWELNYNIRTGSLSPLLLRPLNPLVFSLAETIAAMPFRVVVLSPIVAALLWWRPQIAFWPGIDGVLLGCVSVALAFALAWLVQVCFATLAFWFEQSVGLYSLWFVAMAVLGGYAIPVPLLPTSIQAAARLSPFHSALGAAIEVWTGTAPDRLQTVVIQLGWVVIMMLAATTFWRRGLRRYGAVGA